ncbi:hypothetical protein HN592_04675 [Candidatus Woesearchaeota archaeon]|jgi:hypothetical protein|nr:hypothetical protein [Candidatus Woesearchaeota archaeon]MBT4368507.1 hypothetical protein [Candidatus Woesearchaeota archaeon]MBT4712996.1 hypothetical protein [Candidatus Woesearchaeota archaeon]MBT6639908.1 hypothetical protein [Candidatus Woesearchaeota archaeon]MBT7134080.1 hypothetical protein [Candidatus Woesearchaeota archaeon]
MKILENLGLKKQNLNSKEYAAAVKRKDMQIKQLERDKEVLRTTLLKKEREILEMKDILKKAQKSL